MRHSEVDDGEMTFSACQSKSRRSFLCENFVVSLHALEVVIVEFMGGSIKGQEGTRAPHISDFCILILVFEVSNYNIS